MAPPHRVMNAFRAMKELGIGENTVKPVLKKLLKLYDKKWELIEEENYRALADAIFENEETEALEKKNKPKNVNEEEDLVLEAQGRPLKRLHLVNDGQAPSSISNSSPGMDGTLLKKPKIEEAEQRGTHFQNKALHAAQLPQDDNVDSSRVSQPQNKGNLSVSPKYAAVLGSSIPYPTNGTQLIAANGSERDVLSSQPSLIDKGKEPISHQNLHVARRLISDRSRLALQIKEPKVASGIVLLPKQKAPDNLALIKPKDEPFVDDIPQLGAPLAVVHPEQICNGTSILNDSNRRAGGLESRTPEFVAGEDTGPSSLSKVGTTSKPADGSTNNLGIASSSSGEVKIYISCESALGRPEFHMPSLDAVVETAESRFLKSIDPNISLRKLMKDFCECFLELATDSVNEPPQERSTNVTVAVESLKKSSASDTPRGRDNTEDLRMPSSSLNGSVSIQFPAEVVEPQSARLSSSLNGNDDCRKLDEIVVRNGSHKSGKETNQIGPEHANNQHQLTPDDMTSFQDVNDISKGEEKIKISWVNDISNERPPSFHYIPQNLIFKDACVKFSLDQIRADDCCTCYGNCLSSSTPCACANRFGGEFAYTMGGVIKEAFLDECKSMTADPRQYHMLYCEECPLEKLKSDDVVDSCRGHLVRKFIRECYRKCDCHRQCGNRVVQRGIAYNLQVFFTPERKGWGLRTLEDIPKGAFVCEYVGEILTNTELKTRKATNTGEKDAYVVLLDADWGSEEVLQDEKALYLDAREYGNVARFINHRCSDANLIDIPVEVETPDHHYYRLAFFTSREVNATEELTWDYGIDFEDQDHPIKSFRCLCGSKLCRNIGRTYRSSCA